MTKKTSIIFLASLGLLAAGCAKDSTLATGEKSQVYLNLYMERYHPGVSPNADGIYILEETQGSGKAWSSDSTYTYAETTIRTLDGTITSTTSEKLSQQLGSYSKGSYYGPRYMQTGSGISYAGVDCLFTGLREGGTRRAIIPSWLLTTSRYDTSKEYLDKCSSEVHLEYTVRFHRQLGDIVREEKDSLQNYVKRHFGPAALTTVTYTGESPDGTFYFVSDSSAFIGTQHFPVDTTLKLNYTGRLLNGQVFDTTVEKVAKDAGIYDGSKTYTPVSISFAKSWKEIAMGSSSSLIDGFKGGLSLMHWQGQEAVVLFTSSHGYSSEGSLPSIPPFSPLIFELSLPVQ